MREMENQDRPTPPSANQNINTETDTTNKKSQTSGDMAALFGFNEIPWISAEPSGRRGRRTDQRLRKQQWAGSRRRVPALAVVLIVFALLIGTAVGGFFVLREKGRRSLLEHRQLEDVQISAPDNALVSNNGRNVIYNGRSYVRNDAVINLLIMGIDKREEDAARENELTPGEEGQADTIFLAALNTDTGEITLVNFSRDSMGDVDVYNIFGDYVDTEEMQICLAYAYGDGAEKSCENEVKTMTRLMYGIPIDAYAAMEMASIPVLNDAVGGVTVYVLEDLSSKDPLLVKGATVTLNGQSAMTYVRSRDSVALDANNSRMARQREYVKEFIGTVIRKARRDLSVIGALYQAVQTYMHTNIGLSEAIYLADIARRRDFGEQNIVTVPGKVVQGEEFAEYYIDEDALYQIILDTYYNGN